jgi:molybdopterin molybdotransferase
VVVQEDSQRDGDQVLVAFPAKRGHHVRGLGSELAQGELMLPRQALLGSGELALLASQEMPVVRVFRKPRVSILCSGDELREIGEAERPASIVNSNAYGLAAQVLEAGGVPIVLPRVGDQVEEVERAIRGGLAADVLVVSGGVSVGDYDVVRQALERAGVRIELWKIAMKPGKPLAFGRAGDVPVFGLPGNPVSSWVTFELFVRPGLRTMLGDPQPERPRCEVQLTAPLQRKPGRTEFLRAQLALGPHGWLAKLRPQQGSGALASLGGVDALVVVPANCGFVATDQRLEALILRAPPSWPGFEGPFGAGTL